MKLREAEILREKALSLERLAMILKTVALHMNIDILDIDKFNEALYKCKIRG